MVLAEEISGVIDHHMDLWRIVWMLGMETLADGVDERVDLDRVNFRRSMAEGGSRVVTGTGADHQHPFVAFGKAKRTIVGTAGHLAGKIGMRSHELRGDVGDGHVPDVVDV